MGKGMLSSIICVLALLGGCGENADLPVPDPSAQLYFSQQPPGDQATIFAPGIVSITGRYEYALSVSPDGSEIFFSAEVPDQLAAIFHSQLGDTGWAAPRKVSLTGNQKKAEIEAFFTPDGRKIYFAPYDEGMDVKIWVVDRSEEGWREPRELGPPLTDDPAFFPTATLEGTIYYSNLAEGRVFRATMDGDAVQSVEDAGLEFGGHAIIAPDESFVLVDGSQGDDKNADIFVAFRDDSGGWTTPVSLGPEVNTEYIETCPTLSHDGNYLFFSRYNEEGERSNIYWIESAVIARAHDLLKADT
jgi:Tol biopolymer transport system component